MDRCFAKYRTRSTCPSTFSFSFIIVSLALEERKATVYFFV